MSHIQILFLLILLTLTPSWATRKSKLQLHSNDKCCILAKSNINATRANHGREYFAKLIFSNDSYKDVNENSMCSLMHFFMQEAVINGRSVIFSRGIIFCFK